MALEENKLSISSLKKFGIAGQWSLRNGLMGLAILAALLFAASAHAVVQSSANFTMNSNVFDSGGGSASSANFQLRDTSPAPWWALKNS